MQVLRELADVQAASRLVELHNTGPCTYIREAAGLEGIGSQHRQCHNIRMSTLKRLTDTGMTEAVVQGLEQSITTTVVHETAAQVLQLPELLTLPDCITEYPLQQRDAEFIATGGLAETLLRLCFVHTRNIKVTYYTHNDVACAHQRQVMLHPSRVVERPYHPLG